MVPGVNLARYLKSWSLLYFSTTTSKDMPLPKPLSQEGKEVFIESSPSFEPTCRWYFAQFFLWSSRPRLEKNSFWSHLFSSSIHPFLKVTTILKFNFLPLSWLNSNTGKTLFQTDRLHSMWFFNLIANDTSLNRFWIKRSYQWHLHFFKRICGRIRWKVESFYLEVKQIILASFCIVMKVL